MKIGIITFHFASNYGAVLQCYALQTYLEKQGHEVEIINYRPVYHTVRYTTWKNPFIVASSNVKKNKNKRSFQRINLYFRGFARAALANLKQTDKVRSELFDTFTQKYLHQTKTYTTIKQLKKNPPKDDVYISGSDQLWNPDLLDGKFDEAYFLRFGNDKTRRITYAVSLKEKYTDEEKRDLLEYSKGLDQISTREHNVEFEKSMNTGVDVCVDPTLLLGKEAYHNIEAKRMIQEPYVFLYGFESSEDMNMAIKEISSKLRLKIINGSPHRIRLTEKCDNIYNYGPSEFLSYIKYADFVITNSFHGTAFSIIYHKQFVVIPHSSRGKRMTELLQKLGISNRSWNNNNYNWQMDIDYSNVDKEMKKLKNISDAYFKRNLE